MKKAQTAKEALQNIEKIIWLTSIGATTEEMVMLVHEDAIEFGLLAEWQEAIRENEERVLRQCPTYENGKLRNASNCKEAILNISILEHMIWARRADMETIEAVYRDAVHYGIKDRFLEMSQRTQEEVQQVLHELMPDKCLTPRTIQ